MSLCVQSSTPAYADVVNRGATARLHLSGYSFNHACRSKGHFSLEKLILDVPVVLFWGEFVPILLLPISRILSFSCPPFIAYYSPSAFGPRSLSSESQALDCLQERPAYKTV